MTQRDGRRSFGYLRKLPSRRWQASYVGPDSSRHMAPVTYDTKMDAEAWLVGERRLITDEQWRAPAERTARLAELERARLTNTFAAYLSCTGLGDFADSGGVCAVQGVA